MLVSTRPMAYLPKSEVRVRMARLYSIGYGKEIALLKGGNIFGGVRNCFDVTFILKLVRKIKDSLLEDLFQNM